MGQFFIETEDKNKEAVFGALSSFLRGNLAGKTLFAENKGFQWLQHILFEPKTTPRLQKKLLFLINNMIDEHTRVFFSSEENIRRFMELLVFGNTNLTKNWDTRENILMILNKLEKEKLKEYQTILLNHKSKLETEMSKCQDDTVDLYAKEIKLVQKVISEEQNV